MKNKVSVLYATIASVGILIAADANAQAAGAGAEYNMKDRAEVERQSDRQHYEKAEKQADKAKEAGASGRGGAAILHYNEALKEMNKTKD